MMIAPIGIANVCPHPELEATSRVHRLTSRLPVKAYCLYTEDLGEDFLAVLGPEMPGRTPWRAGNARCCLSSRLAVIGTRFGHVRLEKTLKRVRNLNDLANVDSLEALFGIENLEEPAVTQRDGGSRCGFR